MNELKDCPFCGGKRLTIVKRSKLYGFNGLDERIESHSLYVRCNKCFARGGVVSGKVADHYTRLVNAERPAWETTDEKLKDLAVQNWNRRA